MPGIQADPRQGTHLILKIAGPPTTRCRQGQAGRRSRAGSKSASESLRPQCDAIGRDRPVCSSLPPRLKTSADLPAAGHGKRAPGEGSAGSGLAPPAPAAGAFGRERPVGDEIQL